MCCGCQLIRLMTIDRKYWSLLINKIGYGICIFRTTADAHTKKGGSAFCLTQLKHKLLYGNQWRLFDIDICASLWFIDLWKMGGCCGIQQSSRILGNVSRCDMRKKLAQQTWSCNYSSDFCLLPAWHICIDESHISNGVSRYWHSQAILVKHRFLVMRCKNMKRLAGAKMRCTFRKHFLH